MGPFGKPKTMERRFNAPIVCEGVMVDPLEDVRRWGEELRVAGERLKAIQALKGGWEVHGDSSLKVQTHVVVRQDASHTATFESEPPPPPTVLPQPTFNDSTIPPTIPPQPTPTNTITLTTLIIGHPTLLPLTLPSQTTIPHLRQTLATHLNDPDPNVYLLFRVNDPTLTSRDFERIARIGEGGEALLVLMTASTVVTDGWPVVGEWGGCGGDDGRVGLLVVRRGAGLGRGFAGGAGLPSYDDVVARPVGERGGLAPPRDGKLFPPSSPSDPTKRCDEKRVVECDEETVPAVTAPPTPVPPPRGTSRGHLVQRIRELAVRREEGMLG
ncbi:hypothetical protein HDU67_008156 [Dinochytrium kinnereticum]|nr:hypothetical protein HDU67_008156 [Dinochytrium kinnereticum]